jgi:tetratricopeptide (TPR) repeat protein
MKRFIISVFVLIMSIFTYNIAVQGEIPDTLSGSSFLPEVQYSFTKLNCDPKIYKEGIRVFKELVEINPDDKDWNYYLGMCYYNLDMFEEADKYLAIASEDIMYKIKIMYLKNLHDKQCVRL